MLWPSLLMSHRSTSYTFLWPEIKQKQRILSTRETGPKKDADWQVPVGITVSGRGMAAIHMVKSDGCEHCVVALN